MKTTTILLIASSLMTLATLTQGHGRLRVPPGRSTLWRDGLNTDSSQVNYNDNQLFCGGMWVQYGQNGGKCGLCGDPWNQATPRDNEQGGRHGRGTIVGTYLQGQQMDIGVQLTAHHKGWFEYKLCPYAPATQACFDANLLALTVPVNGETRYMIPQHGAGWYNVTVQLPAGVSCTQCVLQWRYHTGNNWGTDPDGTACTGCGNQEEFYGCADISITSATTIDASTVPSLSTSTTTKTTSTATVGVCKATGAWKGDTNMDKWCVENCFHVPSFCPSTHCDCPIAPTATITTASSAATSTTTSGSTKGGDCKATGAWKGDTNMDKWCVDNCFHVPSFCPSSHCDCPIAQRTTAATTTSTPDTTPTTTILSSTKTTPTTAPVCMKYTAFDTQDNFINLYCETQCPGCRSTLCRCADNLNCRGIWDHSGLDSFCTDRCRQGDCPSKHCACI